MAAVRSWLVAAGVADDLITTPTSRGWLQFDAGRDQLEKIFSTKYHYYEHLSGDHQHIGCEEYWLPLSVQHHIDYVVPGVMPLTTRRSKSVSKRHNSPRKFFVRPMPLPVIASLDPLVADNCSSVITPACIREL